MNGGLRAGWLARERCVTAKKGDAETNNRVDGFCFCRDAALQDEFRNLSINRQTRNGTDEFANRDFDPGVRSTLQVSLAGRFTCGGSRMRVCNVRQSKSRRFRLRHRVSVPQTRPRSLSYYAPHYALHYAKLSIMHCARA